MFKVCNSQQNANEDSHLLPFINNPYPLENISNNEISLIRNNDNIPTLNNLGVINQVGKYLFRCPNWFPLVLNSSANAHA